MKNVYLILIGKKQAKFKPYEAYYFIGLWSLFVFVIMYLAVLDSSKDVALAKMISLSFTIMTAYFLRGSYKDARAKGKHDISATK